MNIQNDAFQLKSKKPNKQKACEILENLYKNKDLDVTVKEDLAHLYKFFISNPPTKPKNLLQWVSKVKSKKSVRFYITEMYIRDNILYGTDGDRMHVLPVGKPDGYYSLNAKGDDLVKINLDGTFPQCERIIPHKTFHDTFNIEDLQLANGFSCQAYKINIFDTFYCVNKKFLDDSLSIADKNTKINVYTDQKDQKLPLLIEIGEAKAVIMPLNVKFLKE